MKKEVDFYQEYLVGIQLPEGIPPPMLGYTHRDLVIAATERVAVFLEQENIQAIRLQNWLISSKLPQTLPQRKALFQWPGLKAEKVRDW